MVAPILACIVASLLVWTDMAWRRLPLILTGGLLAGGLVHAVWAFSRGDKLPLFGMGVGFMLPGALALYSRGHKMGGGDVLLCGGLGGLVGIPDILVMIVVGSLLSVGHIHVMRTLTAPLGGYIAGLFVVDTLIRHSVVSLSLL